MAYRSAHMQSQRTAKISPKMYGAVADQSNNDEDGADSAEPRGNYQRISDCRSLRPQQPFTTLQCIADKASAHNGRPGPESPDGGAV